MLDGIKRASRDWAANNRNRAWHSHQTDRLAAVERLSARPDLAANLDPTDHAYIAACRKAETDAKRGRWLLQGAVYTPSSPSSLASSAGSIHRISQMNGTGGPLRVLTWSRRSAVAQVGTCWRAGTRQAIELPAGHEGHRHHVLALRLAGGCWPASEAHWPVLEQTVAGFALDQKLR